MSGWTVPQRELHINLEGDFGGAELVCKLDVSIGTFVELQKLSSNAETIIESYRNFGDNILLDWNFKNKDGFALTPDGAGMLQLPPAVAISILGAWTTQASGNPVDSDKTLNDGNMSEAESTKKVKK